MPSLWEHANAMKRKENTLAENEGFLSSQLSKIRFHSFNSVRCDQYVLYVFISKVTTFVLIHGSILPSLHFASCHYTEIAAAMQLKAAWIQQIFCHKKVADSAFVSSSTLKAQRPFALFVSELHLNLHSFWMTCFLSGHKLPSSSKILCNDSVPELLRLKRVVKVP